MKKEQEAGFLEPEKPSHSKVREPSPSVESTYSMGDFPEEVGAWVYSVWVWVLVLVCVWACVCVCACVWACVWAYVGV